MSEYIFVTNIFEYLNILIYSSHSASVEMVGCHSGAGVENNLQFVEWVGYLTLQCVYSATFHGGIQCSAVECGMMGIFHTYSSSVTPTTTLQ